jgi:hypothetical protein
MDYLNRKEKNKALSDEMKTIKEKMESHRSLCEDRARAMEETESLRQVVKNQILSEHKDSPYWKGLTKEWGFTLECKETPELSLEQLFDIREICFSEMHDYYKMKGNDDQKRYAFLRSMKTLEQVERLAKKLDKF